MKIWNQLNKFEIHLELSSSCQAACPACSRVYDYNDQVLKGKTHNSWDINSLHRVFNKEVLAKVDNFLLCGNYGDPLAFTEIDQWIQDVLHINPSIKFWLHTNGGLGSTKTWSNLGQLLRGHGSSVNFSIDGLSETNDIYRRGVHWDSVIANAKTFIDAGGSAIWKFIDFKHNHHQIEEARDLANSMGFKKFKVIQPYSDEGDISLLPESSQLASDLQVSFEHLAKEQVLDLAFSDKRDINSSEINCEATKENSLYVDCDKKVWPCCWVARTGDHRTRLIQREEFYRKVYDEFGLTEGFNSLKKSDLLTTLEHSFFEEFLPNSWERRSLKKRECLSICLEKCSKAKTIQE